jgi:hypothetical protein
MSYNAKNYTEQGGEITHIGGKLVFDEGGTMAGAGVIDNMAALTSATNSIADLREKFNDLLTLLKDGGLMAGDAFALAYSAVTTDTGHDDRMFNTSKIGSVAVDNDAHTVTITLTEKVEDLKDFDGQNGWGIHKWLGIGLVSGINYPTVALKYNDTALTADDASEASGCGCTGTGVFVRWVAADLVLAGDNTQKSVDTFTLWASNYAETTYKLVIVEPSE